MQKPAISDSEWEVMNVLWDEGPLATRNIYAFLLQRKKWAINTVKTLLLRLVNKGMVEYDQIGNSYLYKAAVSRESMTEQEVKVFVDRVFGGSFSPFLAHFVENEEMSEEELDQIQQLISSHRAKRNSTKAKKKN